MLFRSEAWASEEVSGQPPAAEAAFWKWSCLPLPWLPLLCPGLSLMAQLDEGDCLLP